MKIKRIVALAATGLVMLSGHVFANVGWGDKNDTATQLQPVFYANSPRANVDGVGYHDPMTDAGGNVRDCLAAPVAGSTSTSPAGVTKAMPGGAASTYTVRTPANTGNCYTGRGIRKFVDQLPMVKLPANKATPVGAAGDAIVADNKYVPVAVPVKWKTPDGVSTNDDYYEIAVVEFKEKLHTDLPASTLRGYVQIDPYCTDTNAGISGSDNNATASPAGSGCVLLKDVSNNPLKISRPDKTSLTGFKMVNAYAVDYPHYLGPVINATKNVATRVKFYNLLPVGHAVAGARNGDMPIPVDETLAGAGFGPDGVIKFSQNRSNIHLHGGDNPWISDGTPHQWIAPAGEGDATDTKSMAYAVGQLTSTAISPAQMVPGRSYTVVTATTTNWSAVGGPASAPVNKTFVATASSNAIVGTVKLATILATAVQAGETYVIASTGNTNFTACGASASTANTVFTATGACTGTGAVVVTTNYLRGASQKNVPDMVDPGPGAATFYYPNGQSVRMLWYHDHTYGLTRLNVYMGQASAYMLHDADERTTLASVLGAGYESAYEIPLVLQDKTFVPLDVATQDAKWDRALWGDYGDLWYPHVYEVNQARARMNQGANPSGRWDWGPMFAGAIMPYYGRLPSGDHALVGSSYWVNTGSLTNPRDQIVGVGGTSFAKTGLSEVTVTPEAFFDTPLVNGQAYPKMSVAARPYRLRVLNAANDRFFNLGLFVAADKVTYPNKWPFDPTYSPEWLALNKPNMCTGKPWAAGSVAVGDQLVFSKRYYKVTQAGSVSGSGPVSTDRNATIDSGTAKVQFIASVDDCTEVHLVDQAKFDDVVASAVANPDAGRDEPGLFGDYWGSSYTKGIFFDPVPYPGMNAEYLGPALEMMGNESGFLPKRAHIPPTPIGWVENPKDIRFMTVGTHGLYLSPAGRADVVVDFRKYAGKTLILYNDSPAPAPVADTRNAAYTYGGDLSKAGGQEEVYPGYGPNVRTVMQIYVDPDLDPGTVPVAEGAEFDAAVDAAVAHMYGAQHTLVVDTNSQSFGTVGTGTFNIATGNGANATYGYEGLSFVPPKDVNGGFPDGNMYYSVSPNPTTCTLLNPACTVTTETIKAGTARLTNVNAGNFTPGITYEIVTEGGTDWVAAGFAPNDNAPLVGQVFTATSNGANLCISCVPAQSMVVGQSYVIDSLGSSGNTTPFQDFGTCLAGCGAGDTITITSVPATGDGAGHLAAVGVAKPRLTAYVEGKMISEAFETTYGRMNAQLGIENVMTNAFVNNIIPLAYIDVPTEMTKEGQVHFWKMDHLGVDSHPVHFHQFDVQVISRVGLDGMLHPVMDDEQGWKETVVFNPLEIAYVAIRAKTPRFPFGLPDSNRMNDPSQPLGSAAGFTQLALATAAPTAGVVNTFMGTPGNNYMWEYVWHCHILGHEENDFMRPILFDFWQGDVATVPSAPTALSASVSGSVTTLQWTDTTPAAGINFVGGIASCAGAGANRACTLTVSSGTSPVVGQVIAGDGVALGTTVTAGSGSTFTVKACATCPAVATVNSGTPMYVSNRSDEIGFTVTRTALGSGLAANKTFTLPANVQSAVDTEVTVAPGAGKGYKYSVAAYNRNGASTTPATTALDGGALAPTSLAAGTATASTVPLSWVRGGANEAGFNVYYQVKNAGSWTKFGNTLAANVTSATVTGLDFGTLYTFKVEAVTFSGLLASATLDKSTDPLSAAPGTATISNNVVTLPWTNPGTFNTVPYYGANIRVCKASSGATGDPICGNGYVEVTGLTVTYNNNTRGTSATVAVPANETLMFYVGVNTSSNVTSNAGGGVYKVYAQTLKSAPAAATNVVATNPANCVTGSPSPTCSVTVKWTTPAQTGTGTVVTAGYKVLRNGVVLALAPTQPQISASSSTGYVDATALPGVVYNYSIQTTNSLGAVATSAASANITTPAWFATPTIGTISGASVTGTSPSLTATARSGNITVAWTSKSAGVSGQSVYWRSCTANPCPSGTAWSGAPVAGTIALTGGTTGSATNPVYNGTYSLTFNRTAIVPTNTTNRYYEFEVRTGVGSGTRVTPPNNGVYTSGSYAPSTSVVRFKY